VTTFTVKLPLDAAFSGVGLVPHGMRPLLRTTFFSIVCKSWSRLAGSTGSVLPSLVEFEISGIPINAWDTSMTAQLLSPFAWIRCVHLDTVGLMVLAVFRCTAWTSDVSLIPTSRELWIVEPPWLPDETPPGKKTPRIPQLKLALKLP
jgi:hypothetical protein